MQTPSNEPGGEARGEATRQTQHEAVGETRLTETGMIKPEASGVRKLVNSTRYSWYGLKAAWKQEEAFRLELGLAVVFLPGAFVIGDGLAHQLLLALMCGLVVLAELINTAIESVVDRVSSEMHPLSGQAKDLGSAIVFTTLCLFWIIWGPSLWHYWRATG